MEKQLEFPFMQGQFRHRFNKVYVCDFEYANVGGELIPTSLAIKNINEPDEDVEFIWLRDEDNNLLTNIDQPYDEEYPNLMVVYFAEAEFCVSRIELAST